MIGTRHSPDHPARVLSGSFVYPPYFMRRFFYLSSVMAVLLTGTAVVAAPEPEEYPDQSHSPPVYIEFEEIIYQEMFDPLHEYGGSIDEVETIEFEVATKPHALTVSLKDEPEPEALPLTKAEAPVATTTTTTTIATTTTTQAPATTSPPATSPPTTTATTVPASSWDHGAGVEQWRGLVEAHFDPEDVEIALCLMGHESGGNPSAKNSRSSAAGLFQFLKSTWDKMVPSSVTGGSYSSGQVFDAEANIRSAAWLQDAAGWSQWSPWNRGKCH